MIALVEQHRPKVVVELGTHRGQSAVAIARVIGEWGGVIYCVDTWHGVPAPGKRRPMRIFECATNLAIAKVSDRVRLIPATTTAAAKAWTGPEIDFLYVDADHSYEGCKADLEAWEPHLRYGALIAGDDVDHPRYPGVRQAWEEFGREHGVALSFVPTPDTTPPGMSLVYGLMQ